MLLNLYEGLWAAMAGQVIRRFDAQAVHHQMTEALRLADDIDAAMPAIRWIRSHVLPDQPTHAGGVQLPHPIILAAGFVKGDGFADEREALAAVEAGRDVLPGWRTMPALVGAVEFGSFTRHPRLGNPGTVMWRDDSTGSTQNRVGLRNPGAQAAACFLAARRTDLPPVWGINLAVSPGVTDPDQELAEIVEAAGFFVEAFDAPHRPALSPAETTPDHVTSSDYGRPSWYTLNLSCPNTDDDPGANQTTAKAQLLCSTLVDLLPAPLWVKVSPCLAAEQYAALMHVFAETGVRAVVATNTLAQPTPDGSALAGVAGGKLRPSALAAAAQLSRAQSEGGYPVDIIGGGGILTGGDLRTFQAAGTAAVMVYSALVFRGPLAAALILNELEKGNPSHG